MTPDTLGENGPSAGGPRTPEQNKDTPLFGTGAIIAVTAIVVLLIAYLAFSAGLLATSPRAAISPSACGEKTLQYINANLAAPGTAASLVSARGDGSVDTITIQYQLQTQTIYTTADCSLLFPSAINMSAPEAAPTEQQQALNKSSRPSVDLYVMSFCPYGTQAEEAMAPVQELLGAQADFHIRYITSVSGSTADSVQSLHGTGEAAEDLRQACIKENYPGLFWQYLIRFDQECYPSWQNTTAFGACEKNLELSLGMDAANITACSTGAGGLSVIKTDETAANANGATASPTLLINGVAYTGARTPEAYKEAICSAFDTAPPECNTTLASQATTVSGGGCG